MNVKLSILGSDAIGNATGKVFARYWFDVIFHDRGHTVLNAPAAEGYRVSSDLADRVKRSNISFICVLPYGKKMICFSSRMKEANSTYGTAKQTL